MGSLPGTASAETGTGSRLDNMLEEVVITARKREEGLQDAPLAVTAFSGESLEARGITNIQDIGSITPNMTYVNNPQAGGASSVATVYIRGVGQRDFLGTIDNGVGFYIDGVYIARTIGATVDLVDVERVEVLRGPQGTLFGRNNVGGAIALYNRKPYGEFAGHVEGTVGTDDLARLKLSLNTPLTDSLFANFAALDSRQDGYVDRPAGGDLGDDNSTSYRGSLLWQPTDALEVQLSGDYSEVNENGAAFTLLSAGTLAPGGFAGFYNNVTAAGSCAYPGGITTTNPACYN
ncbi:MAG: TonB-dependent receptor plug domain-containing protein, partial [Chromatocurvus sp.]